MIDFVTGEIGEMFHRVGVARCVGSLGHVLVHLYAFGIFRRLGVYEALMVDLDKAVELGVLLEVLLVLIGGDVLQNSGERQVIVATLLTLVLLPSVYPLANKWSFRTRKAINRASGVQPAE